jgi:hypothetical protein
VTRSPSDKTSKSPQTTSRLAMFCCLPSSRWLVGWINHAVLRVHVRFYVPRETD